jgi:serine/threonine protein kinase/tetratricopeptide (TPR) repeat protein
MPTATHPDVTIPGSEPDESAIAAYEQALRHEPAPALSDYVPSRSGCRLATLVELVRSDLEWRWGRGTPKPAAAYLEEYPELAAADGAVAALAFEEYRVRLRLGEPVRPDEYRARYQISTESWPAVDRSVCRPSATGEVGTIRQPIKPLVDADQLDEWVKTLRGGAAWVLDEVRQAEPAAVSEWRSGVTELPDVGADFLGFHLVEELGQGAFGRVFLARQGDLAGRLVALKVGTGLFTESQTLAQLQHTNIVPVYSIHQTRQLQAVCMPFFGRTTLASVLKGLRGHPTLPASGDVLLSTVQQCASATRHDSRAGGTRGSPPAAGPDPAAEAATWGLIKRLSYPNAVAWVGAQLASGLAHAHERGILHRDMKPANVLLTDDGVPMLLDFNLAEDTKLQSQLGGAAIGGTLPYMAPEQMAAFVRHEGRPDARSDIYSLGVMLYELLTGRRPFREPTKAPLREIVERLLADRHGEIPSARAANPAVPLAVDAVVRKCLAADPGVRYQSAADLQEDLERHLGNRPLRHAREPLSRERVRKWVARHPRLCSSATVGVLAAILLASIAVGGFYGRERSRELEARSTLDEHRSELRSLQADLDDRNRTAGRSDEALDRCRAVLGRYGISPDEPDDAWERGRLVRYLSDGDRRALRADVGEVFYLMARSTSVQAQHIPDPAKRAELVRRAESWTGTADRYAGNQLSRSLAAQRADLLRLRGDESAERAAKAALDTKPTTARDHYRVGNWYMQQGLYHKALPYLRTATQMDPENLSAWFVRGTCHAALEQPEVAIMCFGSCIALDKGFAPAWLNRGVAFSQLHFFEPACDDLDQALRLDPSLTQAWIERAVARKAIDNLPGAIADITEALGTTGATTRLFFIRARMRDANGDKAGAAADRAEGMRQVPADELSWVARGEARMAADPEAALADVGEALKLNPISMFGLQLKAQLLAERLGRPDEAIGALDKAVEYYPEYAKAVAGRGVLLARAGRRTEAIRDAEEALLRDRQAPNLYQVGCIYALTAKSEREDRLKAFALLWAALRTGFGLDLVDTDSDLDPIRKEPEFRRLVAAAKTRQEESKR